MLVGGAAGTGAGGAGGTATIGGGPGGEAKARAKNPEALEPGLEPKRETRAGEPADTTGARTGGATVGGRESAEAAGGEAEVTVADGTVSLRNTTYEITITYVLAPICIIKITYV